MFIGGAGFVVLLAVTSPVTLPVFGTWPAIVLVWVAGVVMCAAIFQIIRLEDLRKRRESGLCVHCGYDLRASPGRCPECGAAAASCERG